MSLICVDVNNKKTEKAGRSCAGKSMHLIVTYKIGGVAGYEGE